VQKLKLSLELKYKLIVVCILCLLFITQEISAAESQIHITSNKIKAGQLVISFEAQNFLVEKAIEFLDSGFTLKINYTIELWKSHGFWFDEPVAQQKIEHIITYDLVRMEYSTLRKIGEEISEEMMFKIERIVEWATKFIDAEIAPIKNLPQKAFYYYSINAELNMLTVDNLKDLQLLFQKGQESKKKSGVSFLRFISNIFVGLFFDVVVSQNIVRLNTESEKFQLTELTGGEL